MADVGNMELQPCSAILLVGLPGSGKSRLASRIAEHGWIVCCQDDLGHRTACEQLAWETLEQGGHIVIDRTNVCAYQRRQWIQLCQAVCPMVRIASVVLHAEVDECIRRVMQRSGHATLQGDEASTVVERFAAEFEEPSESEGFGQVLHCGSDQDLATLLSSPAVNSATFIQTSPCSFACYEKHDGLASVLGKMTCVYVSEHRANELSVKEGREGANIATGRIQSEAVTMFEEGLFVPTVKIHGRCCRWKGGQPYRRLDINLNQCSSTRSSRKVETQVDIFIERIRNEFGVSLKNCWQAGADRDWSWRHSLLCAWGWISTCLEQGWWPTSLPDRYGHWIGYTPVKHRDGRGHVLSVDHDADVRHGFDEDRGVAFCLEWPTGAAVPSDDRLVLREVPTTAMEDGTYELVGPHDCQGGPYKECLPLASEDLTYPKRFPGWNNDRNERHYFIRHGSVQWTQNPPPNPLDRDAFRNWMQTSAVEGVVWHGTGRFAGYMYKCHFGHLGLPARKLHFTRQHMFMGPSDAPQGTGLAGRLDEAACEVPTIRRCPGLADDVQHVVLLRHGESVAQTSTRKRRGASQSLVDTPLSEHGQMQASCVRVAETPELVVTSPLTRALQTLGIIAPYLQCACIAHPYLQEFSRLQPAGFESLGRTARELQADESINCLSAVDLSLLGGLDCQWWADTMEPPAPRITAFAEWLRTRPERYILLIGHFNVFQELLTGGSPTHFENCDPVNCVVRPSGLCLTVLPASMSAGPKHGAVRLRICREGHQKDIKIVKVQRASGLNELLKIAQNKWSAKKIRPRSAYCDGQDLTEDMLREIDDDTLVTFR